MDRYRCHKLVDAAKIQHIGTHALSVVDVDGKTSEITMTSSWLAKHQPEVGGYLVVYEDGYMSYSPAKAFESGYTLDLK